MLLQVRRSTNHSSNIDLRRSPWMFRDNRHLLRLDGYQPMEDGDAVKQAPVRGHLERLLLSTLMHMNYGSGPAAGEAYVVSGKIISCLATKRDSYLSQLCRTRLYMRYQNEEMQSNLPRISLYFSSVSKSTARRCMLNAPSNSVPQHCI